MDAEAPLVLRELDDQDARWDDFVRADPAGTLVHTLAWKRVIERAFDHEPHYLYVERGERITGVLPLFAAGKWPFGRALVSVPVGVSGGVLAKDEESALLLRDGARAIAEREDLPYVEYKSERARFPALKTKGGLYVDFRQELFGDSERQFQALPKKTRAMIRVAERAHLKGEYSKDGFGPFHDLFALALRNLGTPMFPERLFEEVLDQLPDSNFTIVRENGRIVASVLNLHFRGTVMPYFAASLPEARDVGVNNYLYWFMLDTGYALGHRVFDFGRSKIGTGAYHFKRHFGMQEIPLEYQYDLVRMRELPNVNPTNPKYAKAIELWMKMPVELSKVIGPFITSRLP